MSTEVGGCPILASDLLSDRWSIPGCTKNATVSPSQQSAWLSYLAIRGAMEWILCKLYSAQKCKNTDFFQVSQSYNRSPLPTGGQPYWNVGQTPKDRMRYVHI